MRGQISLKKTRPTVDGGLDDLVLLVAVLGLHAEVGVAQADAAVHAERLVVVGEVDLVEVAEERQLLEGRLGGQAVLAAHAVALVLGRDVVDAERDVLRRGLDRLAGRRREDRVGGEHQEARLHLRLDRERQVDGHLVAVEVGVERRAAQRVQLDRLALDEHRLEALDREAVQRGRAVEHDGLAARDLLEDVPHARVLALDELLGGADGVREVLLLEAADDERLEQDERHLLGEAALPELELGAADDDGAAGVVDALAEQVLAEAAGLALEHVGERLEGAPAGRVDGLLEHALLVADDDVRRLELLQVAEAVVAVDDAAVEVVQVARREAAALELDERAQVRRDDGHHGEDHVLRAGAGEAEALADLEALGHLLAGLLGAGVLDLLLEVGAQLVQVDPGEALLHARGAHLRLERVAVLAVVVVVLLLGEDLVGLERGVARIDHQVVLVVEDALERAGGHVEHEADARGRALEEPDVADGDRQLDVAHALAADAGDGHLDAAAVAGDALVLDALVLAAGASSRRTGRPARGGRCGS